MYFTTEKFVLYIFCFASISFQANAQQSRQVQDECQAELNDWAREMPHANGPLQPCSNLSAEWIECESVTQLQIDNSTKVSEIAILFSPRNTAFFIQETGVACPYFGEKHEHLPYVNVVCRVLPCIECAGERIFYREAPCIKYTSHYFLTTLIYSVFLGVLAADRFYLGYSAIGGSHFSKSNLSI